MHGLVNRSIECFVRDTYGKDVWHGVTEMAALGYPSFEPMLTYDDADTEAVLNAISACLARPRADVMEDIGTYLVSNPNVTAPRRLLRFAGETFEDFLHSLDDLNDRVRLAVPDLDIPQLTLRDHAPGAFSLSCQWRHTGFGHVVVGILRAMADDYGALVYLEHQGGQHGVEVIAITLVEPSYAEGRAFSLSKRDEGSAR